MALNVSTDQFILPRGEDASQSLSKVTNMLWMRNMQKQRLELAKEGKREQAGNFLKDYLNPEHYLTGSEYDPVVSTKLQALMTKGAKMAEEGADAPALLMGLGPGVSEVNQYVTKAKVINKQIDTTIAGMKENKMQGYDYAKLRDAALKGAFHKKDPTTGQDIGLNEASDVDPSTNWVMKAIQDKPGELTTAGDFDAFARESPKQRTLADITQYTKSGGLTKNRVHLTGQNWLVPETDEKGATTGLVPQYDHANDGGQVLEHTFTDSTGKQTKAPIRLLDEGVFDNMMAQKPGAADYIKGLVSKHLNEYNAGSDSKIEMGSPHAKLVARALAYDELNRRADKGIEHVEVLDKPSAAQVQVRVFGGKEQQAYDRTKGSIEAKEDMGVGPAAKVNTVDAFTKVFNNDPDYNDGPATTVGGRNVVDITAKMPKAGVKFGKAAGDIYTHVYRDVANNSLILTKKDKTTQEVPAGKAKEFLSSIAEANGVPLKYVDKGLAKGGFSNGQFTKAASADDLQKNIDDKAVKAHAARVGTGIDELLKTGKSKSLIELPSPDGTVSAVKKNSKWNPFSKKFSIISKDASGKEIDKDFDTKEEMTEYLSKSAPAAKPSSDEDKINKYAPK
jgi:hypothetical protein